MDAIGKEGTSHIACISLAIEYTFISFTLEVQDLCVAYRILFDRVGECR